MMRDLHRKACGQGVGNAAEQPCARGDKADRRGRIRAQRAHHSRVDVLHQDGCNLRENGGQAQAPHLPNIRFQLRNTILHSRDCTKFRPESPAAMCNYPCFSHNCTPKIPLEPLPSPFQKKEAIAYIRFSSFAFFLCACCTKRTARMGTVRSSVRCAGCAVSAEISACRSVASVSFLRVGRTFPLHPIGSKSSAP